MKTPEEKWLEYMNSQIDFYNSNGIQSREDIESIWKSYISSWSSRIIKSLKDKVKSVLNYSLERKWFIKNSANIFNTRELLEDEYSKLQFDLYILLKVVGHSKFYFPRTYFDDLLVIKSEKKFEADLPNSYAGFPLKEFNLSISDNDMEDRIFKVVTYEKFISITNEWRQYFIKRGDSSFIPEPGDVLMDCGACVGDTAMLFSEFVGKSGQVHTFDPIPLHNKYINYQVSINPGIEKIVHVNQLAVGEEVKSFRGEVDNVSMVSAGGLPINNFDMTTIDEYYAEKGLNKVDYIKMDIEGAEGSALKGAASTIGRHKPKLAVAGYHKDEDLWEIPALMKRLNPDYKIYFEHHLPIFWEAVFYAR